MVSHPALTIVCPSNFLACKIVSVVLLDRIVCTADEPYLVYQSSVHSVAIVLMLVCGIITDRRLIEEDFILSDGLYISCSDLTSIFQTLPSISVGEKITQDMLVSL